MDVYHTVRLKVLDVWVFTTPRAHHDDEQYAGEYARHLVTDALFLIHWSQ